jgi:hypothetical protein
MIPTARRKDQPVLLRNDRKAVHPRIRALSHPEHPMIGYVTLGTNDLPGAAAFYDALLAEIGPRVSGTTIDDRHSRSIQLHFIASA